MDKPTEERVQFFAQCLADGTVHPIAVWMASLDALMNTDGGPTDVQLAALREEVRSGWAAVDQTIRGYQRQVAALTERCAKLEAMQSVRAPAPPVPAPAPKNAEKNWLEFVILLAVMYALARAVLTTG